MLQYLQNALAYEDITAVISYEVAYMGVLGLLAVLVSSMFKGLFSTTWPPCPAQQKKLCCEEEETLLSREAAAPRFYGHSSPELFFALISCLVPFVVSYQASMAMASEAVRVCLYGWLTCVTTGLGALPFFLVQPQRVTDAMVAVANTVACGMMLAASCSMLYEAHEHCGVCDWQLFFGLGAGAVFIIGSKALLGVDEEEAGVEGLREAVMETKRFRRALLIFIVMFCHSAAEGVAVGVSFDDQLTGHFGLYVTLLLAVHNIPEGLTVALTMMPQGMSPVMAGMVAMLTSVPQPFMAIAAYLCVDTFKSLLPIGLAFAAGAMIYVSLHELLEEAAEQLSRRQIVAYASSSFLAMVAMQAALAHFAGH